MSLPGLSHPSVLVPRPLRTELGRYPLLSRLSTPGIGRLALLAPSGYGKTTLLAQHARALERPLLWLSLTVSDSEVEFFLSSLRRAVSLLLGGSAPEREATPERTVDALATAVLERHADLPVYIDRTELLSRPTGQLLTLFLEPLWASRVIFSGVAMDALPLARWTAAGEVTVLGSADLAFSGPETDAFLQARDAPAELRATVTPLEGWPAGVSLAASGAQTTFEPADLMREALNVLPASLRDFLPDLSVLSEWHDDVVQALGLQLPAGWLDSLRRAGLPLTPLGRGWFRPHGLLLSTLDAELRRHAARFRDLHARQARRLADSDPLRALHHAGQARELPLILELAATVLPRLKDGREFALMHATLQTLDVPDPPPWWREYRAVARLEVGEVAAGEQELRDLHAQGLTTALGFTALTLLATRRGDAREQLRLAELGLALFPPDETRSLALQRAVALISLGQVHEGLDVCEAAAAQARQRNAPLEEAAALTMGQYAYQMLGRWDERRRAVERADALLEEQRQQVRRVPLLNILADEALYAGDTAGAARSVAQALRIAESQNPVMVAQVLLSRAQIEVADRDLNGAAGSVQQALDCIRRMDLTVLEPFALLARFELCTYLGQADAAEEAFGQAAARLAAQGSQSLLPFYAALRAWAQQDWEAARQGFLEATHRISRSHPARAELYLMELRRREGPLGPADADRARELCRTVAVTTLTLDEHALAPLARALTDLQPDHPLSALLGRTAPPPLPASGPPAPERHAAERPAAVTAALHVRVLGVLGAAAGDRPVRLTLAKSAEVLVWLAWHGAGSSAEIMNDLWSGSRERRHHEYFRVAVRKLRASLVQAAGWSFDPVPYDGQRYRLHPDVQVRLDARTFVTLIGEGRVEEALALYLGEPLPGLEGDWAQDLREQLRSAMLAAVLDAANTPGEAALAGLRRAAQLEPTDEPVNLALIEALLPDRPRDALGAFRTYARHLRAQLDEDVPGAVVRRLKARGLPLT
ncbi:hypothetical protein GCM10017784_36770 [Deinococcus indicus]|uniref:hypothetical protein n=1 Tax=Deinococcus indicus TaxID=223556 RepID=UPI0017493BF9|nr:hypothetical protein [Deinococcus indicus]GHG38718.1 hypothetical protein GCM10017784_36770 [Deinococcus indicus]